MSKGVHFKSRKTALNLDVFFVSQELPFYVSMKQNILQERIAMERKYAAEATRRRRKSLSADFFDLPEKEELL